MQRFVHTTGYCTYNRFLRTVCDKKQGNEASNSGNSTLVSLGLLSHDFPQSNRKSLSAQPVKWGCAVKPREEGGAHPRLTSQAERG